MSEKVTNDIWRVWNNDDKVEMRTYKRVTGELPEMESTKQLVELVRQVYEPGFTVLDVGCAAGHYFNGLSRIDPELKYTGVDATVKYIDFARQHFKSNLNIRFEYGDIFDLHAPTLASDIVFCCNVILHLPDFRVPLENLLKVTKKHLFIRTLISDKTYLNKFLYTDDFDQYGNPINFVHQNTYSFSLLENFIKKQGKFSIELIKDKFESENIKKEFTNFSSQQSAVTRIVGDKQIAGNVIFEWQWLKVSVI
jgi:2-polyprenyl-3-methyl-5-hydroxy-6-metoxy-1,4-benzoquinol methylase